MDQILFALVFLKCFIYLQIFFVAEELDVQIFVDVTSLIHQQTTKVCGLLFSLNARTFQMVFHFNLINFKT